MGTNSHMVTLILTTITPLRQLLPAVDPASYLGLDVDAPAVRWCRRHLPGEYRLAGERPPLDLAGGGVDVAVAVSVFTHLDADGEAAWLAELHGLLAPGGVLLATTHSPSLTWERPDLGAGQLAELAATGTLFVPGAGRFNSASAFHARAYLERQWSGRLRLLSFAEHGLAGYQDVSVWAREG